MDFRNGDVLEEDWPTESDSSEEMNMAPLQPPPESKYTSRTDVVRLKEIIHLILFIR